MGDAGGPFDGGESGAVLEELSHELRTPLTSLTTYLALLGRHRETRAGSESDDVARLARLGSAALADAARMREALDRLLARHGRLASPAARSRSGASQASAMGDRRFDHLWDDWDARRGQGESAVSVLASLRAHQLAEMLAADASTRRAYERNVIATELSNRLSRRAPPNDVALSLGTAKALAQASRTVTDTRRLVAEMERVRLARRAERGEPAPPSEE